MVGKNTGLDNHDTPTAALMNVRIARTLIDKGDIVRADAALQTTEICLIDVGAKEIGPIPDVGVKYNNVEQIDVKYRQKIERLEHEKEKLIEDLERITEGHDSIDKEDTSLKNYD